MLVRFVVQIAPLFAGGVHAEHEDRRARRAGPGAMARHNTAVALRGSAAIARSMSAMIRA